jgi:tetratricopeptide (TPR) repeat protein
MGREAEAIRVYRQAQKLAPNAPGLLLNLGLAHLKQEDYAAALPLFARLDGSGAATAQSRQLLATCELFTGHAAKALELLKKQPRTAEVLFLTGTAHLRLKQAEAARSAFEELLRTARPEQAHYLMGRAYADNGQLEESMAEFRQALALPEARLELAKAQISGRDMEGAEKTLKEVLAGQPGQGEALYYLGALLVLVGREGEAAPFLEKAREARPEAWGAYYYLGRARLQQGDAAAARGLLERASKLNGEEAAVWFQLARAYQTLGRSAEAAAARQQFNALRERSQEALQTVMAPTATGRTKP